jgi:hypothetical protein
MVISETCALGGELGSRMARFRCQVHGRQKLSQNGISGRTVMLSSPLGGQHGRDKRKLTPSAMSAHFARRNHDRGRYLVMGPR